MSRKPAAKAAKICSCGHSLSGSHDELGCWRCADEGRFCDKPGEKA